MLSTIQTKKEIPIYDPSLVFYSFLGKHDGTTFISDDAYGHLNTVTGATWRIQGRTFNGTSDLITFSPLVALTDFTLGVWFNCTSFAATRNLLGWVDANNVDYLSIPSSTSFSTRNTGGSARTWTVPTMSLSTWYYAVATRASNSINVFLDSIASSSNPQTSAGTLTLDQIGRVGASFQYFPGVIGEIWIYNRALTPQEIYNLFVLTKWRYK